MNEEEKKAIEDLKGIDITYFVNGHECANFYLDEADKVSKEIELILNLIENQQKELSNIKEIEKSHQEENGKLRVELEQEKEKNKAFYKFIMFTGGKDIKDFSATEYMRIRQEAYIDGRVYEEQKAEEIIMKNYISKDKIKELLENEIIDISGFRCIAVEDIENLLEDK